MTEALMQDLGGSSRRGGTLSTSVLDVLGWDSPVPRPIQTRQLFTDPQSISIGNNQTFFPADNQQFQITLRMSNTVLDLQQTYIVGRFFAPTGIIHPTSSFASLFQVIELAIGEKNFSYSFQHYYQQMVQHALKKCSKKRDFAEGDLHSSSFQGVPVSFDQYVPGSATPANITGVPAVWIPTSATTFERVDPYQVAVRKGIQKFIQRSDGNFVSYGGVTYQSYTFAVALSDICSTLAEIRYLPMVLGQQLRIALRTTQANECLLQCFSQGSQVQSYGLTNMGIYACMMDLTSDDLNNVLRSRIQFEQITQQIPFQIFNVGAQQTLNLVYNVSAGAKLRTLYCGFFSNMASNIVLGDATNVAANIVQGQAAANPQLAISQLGACQLGYCVQPPILQIVLQMGDQQRVLNTQQLRLLQYQLHGERLKFSHDPIWLALQNVFYLDLTTYTMELDQYGSSTAGSASLIVQMTLGPQSAPTTGNASTQDRTMPFQPYDWNPTNLSSLKCMSFLEVQPGDGGLEMVNGVYHA